MAKVKAKLSRKSPKTEEFVVIGGSDALLWDDIDSPEDDAWAAQVREFFKIDSEADIVKKGGSGSGHYGHGGLTGVWGGSTPGTGGGGKVKGTITKKPAKKKKTGFSSDPKYAAQRKILEDAGYDPELINVIEASGAMEWFPMNVVADPEKDYHDHALYIVGADLEQLQSGEMSPVRLVGSWGGDFQEGSRKAAMKVPETPPRPEGYVFGSGEWSGGKRDLSQEAQALPTEEQLSEMRSKIVADFQNSKIGTREYRGRLLNYAEMREAHQLIAKGEDPVAHKILNEGLSEYGAFGLTWNSALDDERGEVKDDIVTDIMIETGLSYNEVNRAVEQWAHSSNDRDMRSLSLQEAASEEFGVPLSSWQQELIDAKKNERQYNFDAFEEGSSEALSVGGIRGDVPPKGSPERERWAYQTVFDMYPGQFSIFHKPRMDFQDTFEETSAHARSDERSFLGVMYANTQEHFSSVGLSPDTKIKVFRGFDIGDPPRVGEIIDYQGNAIESWSVSKGEASNFGDVVVSMWVPLKNIVSTARTGTGCLTEGEIIILGTVENSAHVVMSPLEGFEE